MKKIVLSLLLVLTLFGCSSAEKSHNTNIISLDENVVIVRSGVIYIYENTKVADVIKSIKSEDESKQKYLGVTNAKQEKDKDVFFEFEFLLVISESKKTRKYYEIIIITD